MSCELIWLKSTRQLSLEMISEKKLSLIYALMLDKKQACAAKFHLIEWDEEQQS